MEHSKNAMYQRVGRERSGWVQAGSGDDSELAGLIITAPAMPVMPAPPVVEMSAPPIVEMPAPPIVEMPAPPAAEIPADGNGLCTTPVMAYVPGQKWEDVYEAEAGLKRGTIFAQLDLPFVGEGACGGE